jgi:hypothetical protein
MWLVVFLGVVAVVGAFLWWVVGQPRTWPRAGLGGAFGMSPGAVEMDRELRKAIEAHHYRRHEHLPSPQAVDELCRDLQAEYQVAAHLLHKELRIGRRERLRSREIVVRIDGRGQRWVIGRRGFPRRAWNAHTPLSHVAAQIREYTGRALDNVAAAPRN